MNCCDEFGNCRQGRDCPARNAAEAATEVGVEDSPTVPTSLLVAAVMIVVLIIAGVFVH